MTRSFTRSSHLRRRGLTVDETIQTVAGVVLGAVLGLALTVYYQDRWEAWRNRRRRLRLAAAIEHDMSHGDAALMIAGHRTGFHLVEGDGEVVLEPAHTVVRVRSSPVEAPPPVVEQRQRVVRQLAATRRVSDETVSTWNSAHLVALNQYRISRTPARDDVALHVDVHVTDYAAFAATVLALDAEIQITGADGRRVASTLRRHFLPTEAAVAAAIRHPCPFLANGVGVVLLGFTDDDKVLLTRRRGGTRARPGQRDVTVVEGIHATHDLVAAERIDVYRTAIRGCREELGVPVASSDVRILAFGVDMSYYQWNFLGVVEFRQSAREVMESHALHARDRWEGRIQPVPADPQAVFEQLRQEGAWDTAVVTTYLAFCHRFGPAVARRAAERVFGRPKVHPPWLR
jgi:hypothetical protein